MGPSPDNLWTKRCFGPRRPFADQSTQGLSGSKHGPSSAFQHALHAFTLLHALQYALPHPNIRPLRLWGWLSVMAPRQLGWRWRGHPRYSSPPPALFRSTPQSSPLRRAPSGGLHGPQGVDPAGAGLPPRPVAAGQAPALTQGRLPRGLTHRCATTMPPMLRGDQ